MISFFIFTITIITTIILCSYHSPFRVWWRARKSRKFVENVKRMRDQ